MDERFVAEDYRGEERRRRWPAPWVGAERRSAPLAAFVETDQEPDQSPLLSRETTPMPG